MATVFKTFLNNDAISTRTLLHEAIPLTGSLASGSYGAFLTAETNIKNYSHGLFQSVYDYAYLSSSANHIFDITAGFANGSALSSSTPGTMQESKINIYNQMAQLLQGYDHTGSINLFDADGNLLAGGTKLRECFFINFARLLTKDEIKKGSFSMVIGTGSFTIANNAGVADAGRLTITDAGAENDFRVNSPAGEYGILSCSAGQAAGSTSGLCGLIFYQAGIAVLSSSIFYRQPQGLAKTDTKMNVGGDSVTGSFTGSSIQSMSDALRHRIYNISFNNTTELNSTIYFVRVNHNDFNYSSNPTYLSGSKIRVKNNTLDEPVAYITTVGMYSADNELLAVAKLSECIKKTPSNEVTLRVRLDY